MPIQRIFKNFFSESLKIVPFHPADRILQVHIILLVAVLPYFAVFELLGRFELQLENRLSNNAVYSRLLAAKACEVL